MVAKSYNITFFRVGVDMLQGEPRCPNPRSDQDKLKEDPVEELRQLDLRSDQHKQKAELVEELELINVNLSHPEKVLYIGKELNEPIKSQLMAFLKDNLDVFAWEHADIEEIDPKVTCYKFNTSPDVKPRQQRRCPLNPE
ncbi:Ribonuclease H [Abeliophyllum distichum]|uniref:Ribonuclease H n=1 Tax=Abeliophyllum distichum TaxID=126358 RepID=A0ABD1SAU9_9LAMI